MTDTDRDADREAVLGLFRAQLDAMLAGNTQALDHLLPASFTLTHITGYEQPKDEWLSQLRGGSFDYHGVEEKEISVRVDGDTAVLSGRTLTDATVYGTRAAWPLELTQYYVRIDGQWLPQRSVATTW